MIPKFYRYFNSKTYSKFQKFIFVYKIYVKHKCVVSEIPENRSQENKLNTL